MPRDLDLARRGDWQAFNRLAEPYCAHLYSLSYRALGQEQPALAATRAGLSQAARHLRQFDGEDLELWLLRWVVAACREHLGQGSATPPTPAPAPGEASQPALLRELGRLPAEQRLALLLVDITGLDYAETGAVLGLTREQVRQRVAQARWQLMSQPLGQAA